MYDKNFRAHYCALNTSAGYLIKCGPTREQNAVHIMCVIPGFICVCANVQGSLCPLGWLDDFWITFTCTHGHIAHAQAHTSVRARRRKRRKALTVDRQNIWWGVAVECSYYACNATALPASVAHIRMYICLTLNTIRLENHDKCALFYICRCCLNCFPTLIIGSAYIFVVVVVIIILAIAVAVFVTVCILLL